MAQRLDTVRALHAVKPAILEYRPQRVDTILDRDIGRDFRAEARCHGDFVDGAACGQRLGLGIVGKPKRAKDIAARLYMLQVVIPRFLLALVGFQDAVFKADALGKPERSAIGPSQIAEYLDGFKR